MPKEKKYRGNMRKKAEEEFELKQIDGWIEKIKFFFGSLRKKLLLNFK